MLNIPHELSDIILEFSRFNLSKENKEKLDNMFDRMDEKLNKREWQWRKRGNWKVETPESLKYFDYFSMTEEDIDKLIEDLREAVEAKMEEILKYVGEIEKNLVDE